ncbi:MAG: lysozyme [Azoarcus sp.]|jgi:lysozyme|nr:lysozyme [Azoarcus sp.]
MAALLPLKNLPWPIDWEGVVLIAQSEGCRLKAYRDVAGVWTLGWGETEGIREGMTWTQGEADLKLCERLGEFAMDVRAHLKAPASPAEVAALVSLAYNIGIGAFVRSSVLRAHNRGDKAGAARAFALWNRAGKRIVQGLVTRRAREAALYLKGGKLRASGCGHNPDADRVRPLTRSPTSQAGAVSIATGGLALASEYSAPVRELAWSLSLRPVIVVAVAAIVVGAIVLWRRWKQRREGVA